MKQILADIQSRQVRRRVDHRVPLRHAALPRAAAAKPRSIRSRRSARKLRGLMPWLAERVGWSTGRATDGTRRDLRIAPKGGRCIGDGGGGARGRRRRRHARAAVRGSIVPLLDRSRASVVLVLPRPGARRCPATTASVVSPADGKVVDVVDASARTAFLARAGDADQHLHVAARRAREPRARSTARVDARRAHGGQVPRRVRRQGRRSTTSGTRSCSSSGGRALPRRADRGRARAPHRLPRRRRATRLERGERYGMIMFGSRVDLYLPPDVRRRVSKRASASSAGETVLGELHARHARRCSMTPIERRPASRARRRIPPLRTRRLHPAEPVHDGAASSPGFYSIICTLDGRYRHRRAS